MAQLADSVVLITGAGSGVGEAMAHAFTDAGSTVVIVDINAAGAERVLAEVHAKGNEAIAAVLDITDSARVEQLITDVVARYGKLDVLCNNAAIMDGLRPATEVSESLWNRVVEVNLTAPYLLSRYALDVMLPRKQGALVNVASIAALSGGLSGAAYTASKHGLIGLSKSIAWQFAPQGIRCNVICPGSVRTPLSTSQPGHDLSEAGLERIKGLFATRIRYGDPAEIAALAVFLASDSASLVNGAVITADAGWSAG